MLETMLSPTIVATMNQASEDDVEQVMKDCNTLNQKIDLACKSFRQSRTIINNVFRDAVDHARKHGDLRPVQRLFTSLNRSLDEDDCRDTTASIVRFTKFVMPIVWKEEQSQFGNQLVIQWLKKGIWTETEAWQDMPSENLHVWKKPTPEQVNDADVIVEVRKFVKRLSNADKYALSNAPLLKMLDNVTDAYEQQVASIVDEAMRGATLHSLQKDA